MRSCILFLSVWSSIASFAAELRPETIAAWNAYIQAADARIAERTAQRPFLWVDESPDRVAGVRNGEILVAPISDHAPQNVPHGLIHDWIGAAFAPGTTIGEFLSVVRDYNRYKDIYAPTVIASKPIRQMGPHEDRFSMVMMNKSLLLKAALESEYDSTFHQLDEKRWYGVAYSTRVQQIEHFGQPDARKLPEDRGSGYIWKLYTFTRYEERDGGVYVEIEAIALSREIPVALRFMAEPVVRRVSRNSLLISLRQTSEAVRSTRDIARRAANDPAARQAP